MELFIFGLAVLLLGYLIHGKGVESVLAPDDRKTPAVLHPDGIDYVVIPSWKNMLIQLLNIAGIGPVIGVITGIKFGTVVFVIIPIGCVLMGAVHDYVGGMMSLRNDGQNLVSLIAKYLGSKIGKYFGIFTSLVLLLVVAVFINVPAALCAHMTSGTHGFLIAVLAIFLYYLVATLFPIDKIIGKIYPIFGLLLLLGSLLLFCRLLMVGSANPELLTETAAFKERMFTAAKNQPIIPLLFVTIACGILSGFHATQSPLVARTMRSEREARYTFFGMMILEGFIAMVWAAAALIVYNKMPELMAKNPNGVLVEITKFFFRYPWVGKIVVISVIVLAVTSGDTALRSMRLTLADAFKLEQTTLWKRILICLPLIVIIGLLLVWSNQDASSFGKLWNYFAWGNQVLAAFTLAAGTAYLMSEKKGFLITMAPGIFITFVELTYILWISPAHGGPMGLGLKLTYAMGFAAYLTILIYLLVCKRGKQLAQEKTIGTAEK